MTDKPVRHCPACGSTHKCYAFSREHGRVVGCCRDCGHVYDDEEKQEKKKDD